VKYDKYTDQLSCSAKQSIQLSIVPLVGLLAVFDLLGIWCLTPLVYDDPSLMAENFGLGVGIGNLITFLFFYVRLPLVEVAHCDHLYFVSSNTFVVYHTFIIFIIYSFIRNRCIKAHQ